LLFDTSTTLSRLNAKRLTPKANTAYSPKAKAKKMKANDSTRMQEEGDFEVREQALSLRRFAFSII
jgi:hypothetical protein